MTYLFFDTETTGTPDDKNAPATDTENWPRVVQIAWAYVHVNNDSIGRSLSYVVRPEEYTIPRAASNIHGITTKRAKREGHPLRDVMEAFQKAVRATDGLVAHNLDFDLPVVGAELVRLTGKDPLHDTSGTCTMKESTEYCKIPGYYGFKWPSLQELHETLFGYGFRDAHDAEADVRAGAKCFLSLLAQDILEVPPSTNREAAPSSYSANSHSTNSKGQKPPF